MKPSIYVFLSVLLSGNAFAYQLPANYEYINRASSYQFSGAPKTVWVKMESGEVRELTDVKYLDVIYRQPQGNENYQKEVLDYAPTIVHVTHSNGEVEKLEGLIKDKKQSSITFSVQESAASAAPVSKNTVQMRPLDAPGSGRLYKDKEAPQITEADDLAEDDQFVGEPQDAHDREMMDFPEEGLLEELVFPQTAVSANVCQQVESLAKNLRSKSESRKEMIMAMDVDRILDSMESLKGPISEFRDRDQQSEKIASYNQHMISTERLLKIPGLLKEDWNTISRKYPNGQDELKGFDRRSVARKLSAYVRYADLFIRTSCEKSATGEISVRDHVQVASHRDDSKWSSSHFKGESPAAANARKDRRSRVSRGE